MNRTTQALPPELPESEIARIMAGNAEEAILTASNEGTTQEQGFALWRANRLLREISKLGLKYPSNEQAQPA
ncbi:MAG: hypothetical protein UY44_C0001G0038 [Candidatus Kaiserbacteria bacterium GW2011_GWA2_49_19]|uniref:Uncharacterized protein n=1 Tax=Candidatus Kaiserbacteria bacterium GW2011_GWA2_49_19 TaxID=1618669 RepID=A0A0G1VSH5_9BACT|nr:MAG: hypothetical protein UY44_C0001G0038 [Candidatus Kaiserbacteria bacterium GW2011_GWA2_49_19]